MIYICIETENAAFDENKGSEIKRIINDLDDERIESGTILRDINGNKVGKITHATRADLDLVALQDKISLFRANKIDKEQLFSYSDKLYWKDGI